MHTTIVHQYVRVLLRFHKENLRTQFPLGSKVAGLCYHIMHLLLQCLGKLKDKVSDLRANKKKKNHTTAQIQKFNFHTHTLIQEKEYLPNILPWIQQHLKEHNRQFLTRNLELKGENKVLKEKDREFQEGSIREFHPSEKTFKTSLFFDWTLVTLILPQWHIPLLLASEWKKSSFSHFKS